MKPAQFFRALLLTWLASVTLNGFAMQPNGTAVYSELGSELYLGTLFLDTPNQSASEILNSSQAKRMELRFTDNMSKRRWAQNWTQSIAINSPRDAMVASADELSATLSSFQSGLKYGDQVVIEYDPLYGTSVTVNGVTIVKELSATLFDLFLSAWIGPVPPTSEFKSAILGEKASENAYTQFLAISPTEERIEAVQNWPTDLKAEEERKLAEAKAEEERIKAEEEAMAKAEEEANKQAEAEKLAEENRQALIEEEKRKAQEAARQAAEEAAREEAELAAAAAEKAQQDAAAEEEDGDVDVSVEAILAQQDYTTQIIRKIYSSVQYPKAAVRKNQQGSVRASVTIDRSGKLVDMVLVEESEHDSLNEAAMDAIKDAVPFPAIPDAVKVDSLQLMVPVAFRLN